MNSANQRKLATLTKVASSQPQMQQLTGSPIADLAGLASFAIDTFRREDAEEQATLLSEQMEQEETFISEAILKNRDLRLELKGQKLTNQQMRKKEEELFSELGLTSQQRLQVTAETNKLTGQTFTSQIDASREEITEEQEAKTKTLLELGDMANFITPVEGISTSNLQDMSQEDLNAVLFQAKVNKAKDSARKAQLEEELKIAKENRARNGEFRTSMQEHKTHFRSVGSYSYKTGAGRELYKGLVSQPPPNDADGVVEQINQIENLKVELLEGYTASAIENGVVGLTQEEAASDLKSMFDRLDAYKKFINSEEYLKTSDNLRKKQQNLILEQISEDSPQAFTAITLSSLGLVSEDITSYAIQAIKIGADYLNKGSTPSKRDMTIDSYVNQGYTLEQAQRIVNDAENMLYDTMTKEDPIVPPDEGMKINNTGTVLEATNVNSPNYTKNLTNGSTLKAIEAVVVEGVSPGQFEEGSEDYVLQSALSAADDFLVRAATRVSQGEIGWDGKKFTTAQTDTASGLYSSNYMQVVKLNNMLKGYEEKSGNSLVDKLNGVVKGGSDSEQ